MATDLGFCLEDIVDPTFWKTSRVKMLGPYEDPIRTQFLDETKQRVISFLIKKKIIRNGLSGFQLEIPENIAREFLSDLDVLHVRYERISDTFYQISKRKDDTLSKVHLYIKR
jgi:hypothetical protein